MIARISGRYSIFALNALFLTMMKASYRFLEQSWVGRRLVDFTDEAASKRIHKRIGITLCILTLVHVLTILLPAITDGYVTVVRTGSFTWPLSEAKPTTGVKFRDVDVRSRTIMLQGDDVFRLVEMTVLILVLIPLSVHWLTTNYRWGIRLHQRIALLYFIDIVRRHTHPHSWVFNIPVFLMLCMDKAVDYYWQHHVVEASTSLIGRDYLVLYWKKRESVNQVIGGEYFLRLKALGARSRLKGLIEPRHPFTAFVNRGGMDLIVRGKHFPVGVLKGKKDKKKGGLEKKLKEQGKGSKIPSHEWDVGVVVRSYDNPKSHTKRIRQAYSKVALDVWGGFSTGACSEMLKHGRSVCLVGGGSGASYLVDVLYHLSSLEESKAKMNNLRSVLRGDNTTSVLRTDDTPSVLTIDQKRATPTILIIFVCNDVDLVEWFLQVLASLGGSQVQCLVYLTAKSVDVEAYTQSPCLHYGRPDFYSLLRQFKLDRACVLDVFVQGGRG